MNTSQYIEIKNLKIQANLGLSKEERATKQSLQISFKINLDQLPKATSSDDIEDTICYDKISNIIKKICQQKEYQLIEKLAHDIYIAIKSVLNDQDKLWLQVTKLNPPIKELEGGASFIIYDNNIQ